MFDELIYIIFLLNMFFVYDMMVSSTICLSCDTKLRMLALMVIELQLELQDDAIFKFTEIPVITVSCEFFRSHRVRQNQIGRFYSSIDIIWSA